MKEILSYFFRKDLTVRCFLMWLWLIAMGLISIVAGLKFLKFLQALIDAVPVVAERL